MKKILVGFFAIAITVASIPLFAAFEAHVINVTAHIENALQMDLTPVEYGTVFPQEQLDKFVNVQLSQSFLDADRVDDVEYMIRQKPKCGIPIPNTDPVEYSGYAQAMHDGQGGFQCPEGSVMLPMLCPYLSKHETTTDGPGGAENDSAGISAFHGDTAHWGVDDTLATQVNGRLAKSEQDIQDTWKLDLKVPCFEGNCDQGWADYVRGINPDADPNAYIQPQSTERQLFGCDLWFEVFGISLPGIGCNEQADVMLVLDRSGSIGGAMPTLKTAAKAFVTALSPSSGGVHMGQSSFAGSGALNLHLTDDITSINAAIDALVSSGTTNLKEGIDLAKTELDNPGDGHDRADAASKDFMVIITDGNPNQPPDEANARAVAKASADAAKAAGVEIYVVGVGAQVDPVYLKTIASGDDHYFAAEDFDDLEAILEGIAQCD